MVEGKATVFLAEATNNQPGMVLAEWAYRNPHVHPRPTSIMKIGTTVTHMAVMLKIPTRAQHVGNMGQRTTCT